MKKIFITLLILIAGHICFAENSVQKINLSEAVNLAIKNNIDFQANKLDTEIAKNNIVIISSYSISDERFEVVYSFDKAHSTLEGGTRNDKCEKLFMVKNS